jgi:hypothetical protein
MAEYTGPATDNEAEVIATMDGHIVPDTYVAGGYGNRGRGSEGDTRQFGGPNPKRIHNDPFDHYNREPEEGYCEPC